MSVVKIKHVLCVHHLPLEVFLFGCVYSSHLADWMIFTYLLMFCMFLLTVRRSMLSLATK